MHSSVSSERTGTDFSAVKHQSHQPSLSISVFIRTSYLRHRRNFTLSPTLVDPSRVSVIRAVDAQDTGLSAQPAEKNRHLH